MFGLRETSTLKKLSELSQFNKMVRNNPFKSVRAQGRIMYYLSLNFLLHNFKVF